MDFKEIQASDFEFEKVLKMIREDAFLLTSGKAEGFNTMTAGWGGVSVMWGKNVFQVAVRPTRHTYQFIEKNDIFTCSFFDSEYKNALNICGTKSGRDINKMEMTGLTPVFDCDTTYFEQAKTVFICKKMYFHDFDPKFMIDSKIDSSYPKKDYHRMYMGEILKILVK